MQSWVTIALPALSLFSIAMRIKRPFEDSLSTQLRYSQLHRVMPLTGRTNHISYGTSYTLYRIPLPLRNGAAYVIPPCI